MKLPGILAHAAIDRPWALLESGGRRAERKKPDFYGLSEDAMRSKSTCKKSQIQALGHY